MKGFTKLRLSKNYSGHHIYLGDRYVIHVVEPQYKTISFHKLGYTVPVPWDVWIHNISRNVNNNNFVFNIRMRHAFSSSNPMARNSDGIVFPSYMPNSSHYSLWDLCKGDILHYDPPKPTADNSYIVSYATWWYSLYWNSGFNSELTSTYTGCYGGLKHYVNPQWDLDYVLSKDFFNQQPKKTGMLSDRHITGFIA